MNHSPKSAAAISWVIACGLLCGGGAMLAAVPAAASPGTGGNSDGAHGTHGDSDSNNSLGGPRRHTTPPKPGTDGVASGPIRSGSGVAGANRRPFHPSGEIPGGGWDPGSPDHHDWPDEGWPCLPWSNFPPIVLPPLPPLPPFPPLHWPTAEIGDGVGVAAPPSARIAPPPEAGGGGSGGLIGAAPRTVPPPGEPGEPAEPPVVSAASGAVGPSGLAPPPITMPPLIGLPPVFEAPLRPVGPGAEPGPRSGPGRESSPTRERPPATSAGAGTEMPPSSRVGYPKYLQDAKIGEVAAVALPGFAGLLALTGLGGFLGYRQAKAGHVVRAAGATRFMQ